MNVKNKAVCSVMQFSTYEAQDPCIEREEIIEVTEIVDGEIEFAFDLRKGRQRVFVRMNLSDLRRMIEAQK